MNKQAEVDTHGAFAGVQVLDMSQGIAGPHAAMLLAQAGANVVKVEPLDGDWGRTLGKRYNDMCAQSMVYNRGKRSIALDLKSPDGLSIAKQLAARADIVVESFRPGVLKRFGLGYGDLKDAKPGLIYLSVTGFGQDGPYSSYPVTDAIIQAFSGWMNLHQDPHGTPMRSGMTAIDVLTGLYAYQAIATAYVAKLRWGEGRYIDCSMLQSAAAFQSAKVLEHFLEKGQPQVSYVPVGVFATEDGFITISAMRDKHYEALCTQLGCPELGTDPRFDSRDNRRTNKEALMPLLAQAFRTRTTAHWEHVLTAADLMNARVNTYGDVLQDEHVRAVRTFDYVDHGEFGDAPVARIPGAHPAPTGDSRAVTPRLGEHTFQILADLGYTGSDQQTLIATRAVQALT